jgi:hypothetical protein
MTRLQTLTELRDLNYDVIERYESISLYLRLRRERAKRSAVESIFTPLFEGDKVEFSNHTIYVYFDGKDSRYADMKIYLRDTYTSEGTEYETEYEISTSSSNLLGDTTKDSEWISTRFEKLAAYSKQAVDFMADTIPALQTIIDKYNPMLVNVSEARKPFQDKSRKANELIKEVKTKEIIEALQGKGVTFTKPEEYKGFSSPEIALKFDWSVSGIKKIKVTKMSASGKSADVEIYTNYYGSKNYDGKQIKPLVADRVRYSNIEDLLNRFNSWANV